MNVSCYFDDSQRYGNFSREVAGFTDTHYSWCYRYAPNSTTPQKAWIAGLVKGCQRAYQAKRYIHLNLNMQEESPAAKTPLKDVLKAMAPFWPRVTTLELADEPKWNKAKTAAKAAEVRAALKSLVFPQRPLIVVYSTGQFPGAPVDALDGVGIEAYCDLPGSPFSTINQDRLTRYLQKAMAAVPKTKDIHLVPMAYSRNYDWLNIRNLTKGSPAYKNAIGTLVALQGVALTAAKSDKRVVSMNFFSWARASGAQEYKQLAAAVRATGKAALAYKPPTGPPSPEPPPEPPTRPQRPRRDRPERERGGKR